MRQWRGTSTVGTVDLLRTVTATRYVTPLREGGSLPAIVEADDLGTYVLKFRGAGQGRKALVAELVAGEIARRLDLLVPEVVLAYLAPELGRSEPDPEIQDLLKRSAGLNLALDYLPGSLGFDPLVETPDSGLASRIVWFDALVTNVDRTPRNTNLLVWHDRLWLIDHGASLYFHHNWPARDGTALQAVSQRHFSAARDHVLIPFAGSIAEADAALTPRLTPEVLRSVIDMIPEEWLAEEPGFGSVEEVRSAYVAYLSARLRKPRTWVEALEEAAR
ncbi:MAG: aminotransferase class I and II [Actinomycetota bacterium]|nr:aminotransferase class I and II [Actinomycetota bacterium]